VLGTVSRIMIFRKKELFLLDREFSHGRIASSKPAAASKMRGRFRLEMNLPEKLKGR
jgi:hypothetical protein